jgi:hypothetical protein
VRKERRRGQNAGSGRKRQQARRIAVTEEETGVQRDRVTRKLQRTPIRREGRVNLRPSRQGSRQIGENPARNKGHISEIPRCYLGKIGETDTWIPVRRRDSRKLGAQTDHANRTPARKSIRPRTSVTASWNNSPVKLRSSLEKSPRDRTTCNRQSLGASVPSRQKLIDTERAK